MKFTKISTLQLSIILFIALPHINLYCCNKKRRNSKKYNNLKWIFKCFVWDKYEINQSDVISMRFMKNTSARRLPVVLEYDLKYFNKHNLCVKFNYNGSIVSTSLFALLKYFIVELLFSICFGFSKECLSQFYV